MAQATEDENMVRYQFQADDDEWTAWKNTVPRSKSLEKRINELIRADTEGRVLDEDADPEAVRDALDRALDELPDDVPGRTAVEDARLLLEADEDT